MVWIGLRHSDNNLSNYLHDLSAGSVSDLGVSEILYETYIFLALNNYKLTKKNHEGLPYVFAIRFFCFFFIYIADIKLSASIRTRYN